MRELAEVKFVIKEAHDRAERMQVQGREVDYILAKGIAEALEWVAGADNGFGVMVEALKAIEAGK